jgi:hypothetical protein
MAPSADIPPLALREIFSKNIRAAAVSLAASQTEYS